MKPPAKWADLRQRMISGLLLALVGIVAVRLGGIWFTALTTVATGLMLWELAAMLGAGRKALIACVLADILWDERQVRVRKGKGGKARRVPLHGEMSRALRAYDKLERHHRATAFRDDGDGRLWPRCSAASVSQRINRFYHGMGIVHTAHKNRHRAGTQAHKASGGDLLVVQRFLGHANPSTSAIYAGLDDEEVQTAIMAIPVAGQKFDPKYDDPEAIAQ